MKLESRRNPLPLPPIQHEEMYSKPIEWKGYNHPEWHQTVCPNCRLNMHHTLASIRWNCRLRGPLKPGHSLDLALSAIYQNGPDVFPEKSDAIRQPETVGYPTWRLLKNHKQDPDVELFNVNKYAKTEQRTKKEAFVFGVDKAEEEAKKALEEKLLGRSVDPTHPLRLGGLGDRISPFSAKIGISSHHSPQSINGYNRNSYGAFYTS